MFGSEYTDKTRTLRAEIDRLNAEAAELVRSNEWREEQAQQIGDQIWTGFQHDNLISRFSDVRTFARDGNGQIETYKGLTAFHVARGGYIEESTITADVTTITRDQIGIHFVEHLDRLEVNFVPSAQRLITLGQARIDAEINRRVLSTYQAAVDTGSPNYVSTPAIDMNLLDEAIAAVEDAAVPGQGTPAPVIIARAPMIRKIEAALTVNNTYPMYTPETNEGLLARGLRGNYRGTPLIVLQNHKDENGKSYFPANEIWIVSKDAAVTGFFGTPHTEQWKENGSQYWHYSQRIDYGVTILFPEHAFRIIDSTVAP